MNQLRGRDMKNDCSLSRLNIQKYRFPNAQVLLKIQFLLSFLRNRRNCIKNLHRTQSLQNPPVSEGSQFGLPPF